MTPDHLPVLDELDRRECLHLLATQPVGRLAVATPEGPLVVPVNFVVDGEAIVFRSDRGSKLFAIGDGRVAFEVDLIDAYHRTGWSVLIRGRAYEATHWEIDHLLLQPWAPGDKRHWIRLPIATITGRRLKDPNPGSVDPRAYL